MNNIQDYFTALHSLQPEIWLTVAIIICSLWNLVFPQQKSWTPAIAMAGLAVAGFSLSQEFLNAPIQLFNGLYTVDNLTVAFGCLSCLIGFIVVMMSIGMEHQLGANRGEYYTILLTAVLAVMFLAGTTDLIMLFVGLETLSICCVLLSGVFKRDQKSNEAALKYLLSTAATTATLLYGLSFLYGITGSTSYYIIHNKLAAASSPSLMIVLMTVLILSAVCFKLSVVPFHMWTPDVYEGAPTPVSAFLSIGSKAGGFVIAIRLLTFVFGTANIDWQIILATLAILSMIGGNLMALSQTSMKRMLAYSSIAHVGYMLIGLIASPKDGLAATMYYIFIYAFMNLGAFTGVLLFSNETGSDNVNDFAGLITKRPWLAIGLSVCLLNLAGLPIPPAGFFAKVFVFWAGVQMQSNLGWLLVVIALVTSVPAIYYYCRPVIKMIAREASPAVANLPDARLKQIDTQFWTMGALLACVLAVLAGSIMVTAFMDTAKESVSPITTPPSIGMAPGNSN
jgi:NAD(P)H-quinone oxidoreductase subunit 2